MKNRASKVIFTILLVLISMSISTSAHAEEWLWPLDGCKVVLSNFGLRDLDGDGVMEDKHRGIDIIKLPQDETRGMSIRAAKSGTIITSINTCVHYDEKRDCGCNGGAGNYVVIQHEDGTYSRYLHMLQSGVHETGYVSQGETIGYVGTSGQSYGYHLHFDMCTDIANRTNTLLNPMPTNSDITIMNEYSLPSGWASEKKTYIFKNDNSGITFETSSASNITDTNATISAWGRNTGVMDELGFYIGNDGAYQTQSRIVVSRNVSWTDFHMQYDINSYYGLLSPGQRYKYSFFCVKDGKEYKSNDSVFSTSGYSRMSFDSLGVSNVTSESATISCWGNNPGGYLISSVGFEIQTAYNSPDKKVCEVYTNGSWTRPSFSFDVSNYCGKLNPDTNYIARFYADSGSVRYYSDYVQFNTASNAVIFDNVSIDSTSDTNATLSVWFSNSGTIDELGIYIGDCEQIQERVVYTSSPVQWTRANIIMDMNQYWKILQPGQTYTYVFYAKKGGNEYRSKPGQFSTTGNKLVSFEGVNVTEVIENNARVGAWFSNDNAYTLTAIGIDLREANYNPVYSTDIVNNVGWTRAYLDYNIINYYNAIKANTTYKVRYYISVNGKKYYSEFASFTTSRDTVVPVISDVKLSDISANGYTITCKANDINGIDRVQFPTWTAYNDQDDIDKDWGVSLISRGTKNGDYYTFRVNTSDHNNEVGLYYTHIIAYDYAGNSSHYELDIELQPHEHEYVSTVTSEAKCNEKGIKTFTCECGDCYTEDIPATGHQNKEVRNAKETTCAEAGYSGDVYCIDCGTLISEGEKTAKIDHEYDEGVITTVATCTEVGTLTFTCKNCDASYTEEIPATGHQNTELRNVKETSCAEAGYTGDTYCTDCEALISAGEEITKLDHEYGLGVITEAPTCTSAGTKTFTCKNCDASYMEEIPATGHQNTEIRNAKEAQVGVEGYTGDKYCKDCDTLLEAGKKIDALPEEHVHSYNSAVTTEPSCTVKGVRTYTCSCGDSYTEEIEKIDHQYDAGTITKKTTCTEDGEKTFKCKTCDVTYTEPVQAEGHIGPEVTKFAKNISCTVDGYTGDVYCSACGSMITEGAIISATGHKWDQGAVVTAASCTVDGLKRFSCQNCDATKDEVIGATGHGETITKFAKAASCKTEGYTGDLYCKTCGEMTKEGSVIEKTDHSWDAGTITTAATCAADGLKTLTCTSCGTTKTEVINATGHGATEVKNAKAATCVAEGYTGDTYCKTCGVVTKKGEPIAKVAHKWDAGKITTQPTTTKPGVKTFTCSVCKGTKTETVPVIVSPTVTPGKSVKDTKTNGYYVVLKDGVSVRFTKPVSKKATVVIPDVLVIDGVTCKVTEIGEKAFYKNTTVTSIKIGNNVTVIGKNAFNGCKNLKKVTGAAGVISISSGAFYGCAKLTSIPLAGTVTSIGEKAFYGCSVLPKISIPAKVKSIGKQAFYNCKKLKTIVIKTPLLTSKTVGAKAFTGTYKSAAVSVPSKVLKSYKSLMKSKGMNKSAKYTALK